MAHESLVFTIFVIFTGAAVLATLALYLRQTLLIAYILLGALAGPAGFGLVTQTELIGDISEIGIMFLLYLLGLNLYPQKLITMLKEALRVTALSSGIFFLLGIAFAWLAGFRGSDLVIIGIAALFSSTILGLKLLPTTALHHRHTGEIIISILLLQDLIAITVLLGLRVMAHSTDAPAPWITLLSLPLLFALAAATARWILPALLNRFDRIQEYIFLLAIGWCLGMAELAHILGLSYEIGAFLAGVAVASSPISRYIAENLRPLRDFFLVVFFFALGARLDLEILYQVLIPAVGLAVLLLTLKPLVFRWLLVRENEEPALSMEVGIRLGQISEFSLLIAIFAGTSNLVSEQANYLIQIATIIGFVLSSYLIVMRYPTPMAVSDRLRRD